MIWLADRHLTGVLLAGGVMLGSLPVMAEPHSYDIDPEHFSIGFLIEHAGYEKLLGMFLEGQGTFVYDEETRELASGRVEVTADSLFTHHAERDKHVKSGDFLAVEKHPSIVFEAMDFSAADDRHGTLTGDLTLLGETHPVTLAVTLNKAATYPFGHRKYTLGVSARTTLSRSEWGMTYGVDNGLVGDEVDLILEFEAIRH